MSKAKETFKSYLRQVSNFPTEGVKFYDVSALFVNPKVFHTLVEKLANLVPSGTNYIVGMESRGFIFATAVAHYLGKPFVLARKFGKIPTVSAYRKYATEYSQDSVEMSLLDLHPGARYVLIDDILATGGTLRAVSEIIEAEGGEVVATLAPFAIRALWKQASSQLISAKVLEYL